MQDNKPDGAFQVIGSWVSWFILFALFIAILYMHSDKFITVWRGMRLIELWWWNTTFQLIGIEYFEHFLTQLQKAPPNRISWKFISAFEANLNYYLKFLYAGVLLVISARMHFNSKKVTSVFNVQTLLEQYADESEAIESLVHDNPLKHNRIYDFTNRCPYHNRHAQAISPQRYIEVCPPVNASFDELEQHARAVSMDKESSFRAIAIIDRYENEVDFCRTTARISLERQVTDPPSHGGYYTNPDSVPRLFDKHGNLIDLITIKDPDTKENKIMGGFSLDGLINNGREYNGSASEISLIFNGVEREVFDMLCARYNHPSVPLAEFVLNLTKRHAYRRTYLVEFLRVVRLNAIMASTEFYMFLRRDRILYFTLYSASEEKPFYEALGVMAHWSMEKLAGEKVVKPFVDTGIRVLEKDANRIAAKKPPQRNLIEELNQQMIKDNDLSSSRAFQFDDKESMSLLKSKLEATL
ncbi:secretion/conjugation apparatus DotM-related subunit [Aliivibrio fischeri]|uniref:DotM C-terminal cytoplasmic domain-containing protein n=1 Tax=Aliivibrio fischeri (strain MJ11) TaxID=388396 RepID=B5EW79_ALIFM|nr:hypothetical protein [Aliivibrio fischeri]ACH64716.1 hypothetical protein VFMJ11_B0136 [Aliivibrio fischeri MJ11]MUK37596.1 hypothetical protein [Aliivibrio fischeri]